MQRTEQQLLLSSYRSIKSHANKHNRFPPSIPIPPPLIIYLIQFCFDIIFKDAELIYAIKVMLAGREALDVAVDGIHFQKS